MIRINISEEIKNLWPDFHGAAIFAKVKNTLHNKELWDEINILSEEYRANH